jgi:cytochrome P450
MFARRAYFCGTVRSVSTTTNDQQDEGSPLVGGPTWPPEMTGRAADEPFAPAPRLREMSAQGPVHPLRMVGGTQVWLVTGYPENREVFADPRFSVDTLRHTGTSVQEQADAEPRADGIFLTMDPPQHTRLRRLLTGQFTVRRMRRLEERITEIAVEHIEAMRAAGTSADLVAAFALPLPSLVICELLGVGYADRAEFQERTSVMLGLAGTDEEKQQAAAALYGFMARLVAAKRAEPADDLLSGLVHAEADPPLTDRELVDIATLLLLAGHETTANMLALSTFALLEQPAQLAAWRADPGIVDGAVEELLRYLSIVHLGPARRALEDVTIGGVEIPAGSTVMLSVPAANRDPAQWPAGADLDITRPRGPHLAFGHGVHQCLGQQLARVELRVGLTELFDRLPGLRLAVAAGEVPLRTDMAIFGVHALPVTWD